jgi:thiol-disulfide isomerase/thioredoxin
MKWIYKLLGINYLKIVSTMYIKTILYIVILLVGFSITSDNQIPDFEFELLGGEGVIQNSDFEGNYYLIYFWSTYCGICISEMQEIHDVYEEFSPYGFEILSVSFDFEIEKVETFREERYPMPWLHTVTGKNPELIMDTNRKFNNPGMPGKILVSPTGEILFHESGRTGDKIREILMEIYK